MDWRSEKGLINEEFPHFEWWPKFPIESQRLTETADYFGEIKRKILFFSLSGHLLLLLVFVLKETVKFYCHHLRCDCGLLSIVYTFAVTLKDGSREEISSLPFRTFRKTSSQRQASRPDVFLSLFGVRWVLLVGKLCSLLKKETSKPESLEPKWSVGNSFQFLQEFVLLHHNRVQVYVT